MNNENILKQTCVCNGNIEWPFEETLSVPCGNDACKSFFTKYCNTCNKICKDTSPISTLHFFDKMKTTEAFRIENINNLLNRRNETIEHHLKFVEEEIEISIESLKIQLDEIHSTFKEKLNCIKKELDNDTYEYEQEKALMIKEYDELCKFIEKNEMHNLEEIEMTINHHYDVCKKLDEVELNINQSMNWFKISESKSKNSFKLQFDVSSELLTDKLVGKIVYQYKNLSQYKENWNKTKDLESRESHERNMNSHKNLVKDKLHEVESKIINHTTTSQSSSEATSNRFHKLFKSWFKNTNRSKSNDESIVPESQPYNIDLHVNQQLFLDRLKQNNKGSYTRITCIAVYEICELPNNNYVLALNDSIVISDCNFIIKKKLLKLNDKAIDPYGITMSSTKNVIYFTDLYDSIFMVDFELNILKCISMAKLISSEIELIFPVGICYSNNNVYVCDDCYNPGVHIFNEDLEYIDSLKVFGINPRFVKVSDNTIVVTGRFCIQFYDLHAKTLLAEYKFKCGRVSQIGSYFYVFNFEDSEKYRIYVYNEEGTQVEDIAIETGKFRPSLYRPMDFTILSTGKILLLSQFQLKEINASADCSLCQKL